MVCIFAWFFGPHWIFESLQPRDGYLLALHVWELRMMFCNLLNVFKLDVNAASFQSKSRAFIFLSRDKSCKNK